jgi:hypothetical protein
MAQLLSDVVGIEVTLVLSLWIRRSTGENSSMSENIRCDASPRCFHLTHHPLSPTG